MRGEDRGSQGFFSYVRLEERIAADHSLRAIRDLIDEDHRTHSRFTALVCQQRANQRLSVDPVSLRTPAPTGCRDRGRIHDVAFDPFILQRAIDPESVEASTASKRVKKGTSLGP